MSTPPQKPGLFTEGPLSLFRTPKILAPKGSQEKRVTKEEREKRRQKQESLNDQATYSKSIIKKYVNDEDQFDVEAIKKANRLTECVERSKCKDKGDINSPEYKKCEQDCKDSVYGKKDGKKEGYYVGGKKSKKTMKKKGNKKKAKKSKTKKSKKNKTKKAKKSKTKKSRRGRSRRRRR